MHGTDLRYLLGHSVWWSDPYINKCLEKVKNELDIRKWGAHPISTQPKKTPCYKQTMVWKGILMHVSCSIWARKQRNTTVILYQCYQVYIFKAISPLKYLKASLFSSLSFDYMKESNCPKNCYTCNHIAQYIDFMCFVNSNKHVADTR